MIPIEFVDYRRCPSLHECNGFMIYDGSPSIPHKITLEPYYRHTCTKCGMPKLYGKKYQMIPDLNFEEIKNPSDEG